MNCEQMNDLLSAFLDGELTTREEEQMNAHLEQCAECRALLEQLQTLRTSFSDLEEIPAPEGFVGKVMDSIKAESTLKVVPLFKRPQMRAVMGLAACAVLCIGVGRVALTGMNSSAEAAPMAIPVAPPIPESAMYDAAPAAAAPESAMEYSMAAGAESKMVEAPMEPMTPAPEAPAEAASMDGVVTICPTGPEGESGETSVEGEIYLTCLPDGLESAVGTLEWEERIEDGAQCARLSPNQAEQLMELAYKQDISLEVGMPAGGEPESWLLILTE